MRCTPTLLYLVQFVAAASPLLLLQFIDPALSSSLPSAKMSTPAAVAGTCALTEAQKQEIASYAPIVNRIIHEVTEGKFRGATYNFLAEFVDRFGHRLTGSQSLEDAIDWMLEQSRKRKHENVHGDPVNATKWVRGRESLTMLEPRVRNLAMLGLGSSVGTNPEGITAEVVVLQNFDQLEKLGNQVSGKIVVFNQPFVSYGQSVKYRSLAASKAARYGAVATLVRSITAFSLNTPHTGWQDYEDGVPKIPTACITVEDANMLDRMHSRGWPIKLQLRMEAHIDEAGAQSRNTVSDLRGSERPESVVVVSGHLDTWDVGNGAMDDGAGAIVGWMGLNVLRSLGLRPRRTIRSILWTAEEIGLQGAEQYVEKHSNGPDQFNLVMESDEGTFEPQGLEYFGSDEGACVIKEILKLFTTLKATKLEHSSGPVSTDIIHFQKLGIPGVSLNNANDKYTWYHHNDADTMDVLDSDTLDRVTAFWIAAAYVVADLTEDIPRNTV